MLYQKWEVAGASGYLGQSAAPILAGLGSERNAEVVRLLWANGRAQDEINLAARKVQSYRRTRPAREFLPGFVFVNGREYEFIADMNRAWRSRPLRSHQGRRDVPDPDEYLKVPARSVKPRNGLLSFRFMEPIGRNGLSRPGAAGGYRSSRGVRSFSERTVRQRAAFSGVSRDREPQPTSAYRCVGRQRNDVCR